MFHVFQWTERDASSPRVSCVSTLNLLYLLVSHSALFTEKVDAIVKYNIVKILKDYEPQAIEESADGYNVNLRKPSSISQLKNPQVLKI